MIQPIKKYMKVGLIHFMAYPETIKGEGPVLETLKKILVDDYFDAIEVSWIKDSSVREQAIKMMNQAHITVACGCQPRLLTTGLNINDLDEIKRSEAVATLKAGIDDAYDYGAVGMAFLSGKYCDETKEDSFNALVKSSSELCEYAKSKGDIPVILEIFDYDVDKASLIGPVEMSKRFAEVMCAKYDNFGLMIDLSHLPLTRESSREAIIPIKQYIKHAHIGNAVCKDKSMPAYGDAHPRFGFPNGENDVDELVEYLRVLFEAGYLEEGKCPIVSFEVKPYGDEDSDIVVANAKRTLNEAWSKLEI